MYKNIEQTQAKVQDAVDELKEAAELYYGTDINIASAFEALATGTNPFA